jgi:hypothetical protein
VGQRYRVQVGRRNRMQVGQRIRVHYRWVKANLTEQCSIVAARNVFFQIFLCSAYTVYLATTKQKRVCLKSSSSIQIIQSQSLGSGDRVSCTTPIHAAVRTLVMNNIPCCSPSNLPPATRRSIASMIIT